MSESRGIAFVMAGGASLGAIEVGMLRALYERGITPDFIVGTSAGALNAAFIASRPQTAATAEALAEIWRGLRRGQVFPLNPLIGLFGFIGSRDHLVPASGLRRLIARYLEVELLEEMSVPLHVVAVDVISGEERRLSEGPALDAVLASAAIPGVFPPVSWEGRNLMDGGVANNTPISHAVELGARDIYVLPTGHSCSLEESPRGSLGMALHALSLMTQQRLIDDIEKHKADANLIVVPPPCPQGVPPIDFSHPDLLIERGYERACEFFAGGGATRPPIRMGMDLHERASDRGAHTVVTARRRRRPAAPPDRRPRRRR
jgi:NTE family protein